MKDKIDKNHLDDTIIHTTNKWQEEIFCDAIYSRHQVDGRDNTRVYRNVLQNCRSTIMKMTKRGG